MKGLPSVRTEGQYGVNCGNPTAGDTCYGNPQPIQVKGMEVTWSVQRLGVEEPTNKTPLAPRNSNRVEEIVQAVGKPSENLLLRCHRADQLGIREATTEGLMPQFVADATLLHAPVDMGVLRGIRMSLWAMSLGFLPCSVVAPIPAIVNMRYSPQVVRPDASTRTADMVNFIAFRDGAIQMDVNPSMGTNSAPGPIPTATTEENPISIGVTKGHPQPTSVSPPDFHPEALLDRHDGCSWHGCIIAGCRNGVNIHN